MKHLLNLSLILLLALSSCGDAPEKSNSTESSEELNVYTHRHYESDKVLFAEFEKETGIKVNVVNAKADELMMKIEQEGELSPADVLITVDAGRLVRAKNKGILQRVKSKILNTNIPAKYRDEENNWFGLTKRARVFIYNPEVMKAEDFSTYRDLADQKWKGTIAVRSSENIYNQSLMAGIIANSHVDFAKAWAENVVKNMCRAPKGNDRDQVKAIAAGQGDIAIVNSYYIGLLLSSEKRRGIKGRKICWGLFP